MGAQWLLRETDKQTERGAGVYKELAQVWHLKYILHYSIIVSILPTPVPGYIALNVVQPEF